MQTLKRKNELEYLEVSNACSRIKIALQGAHIFDFRVKGQSPLLFLSETSHFKVGKAIRGGVPICWPWFGEHSVNSTLPNHGFARTSLWTHLKTEEIDANHTKITLALKNSTETEKLWPYAFRLELEISISERLELSLTTKNTGSEPFVLTQALHTYLLVEDISTVSIEGLDQTRYYDKLSNTYNNLQQGTVTFSSEVDRVYENVHESLKVEGLEVQTIGSNSVVIWNPGKNFKKNFSDLSDYKTMLCIESAKLLKDSIIVEAGDGYILKSILKMTSNNSNLVCTND